MDQVPGEKLVHGNIHRRNQHPGLAGHRGRTAGGFRGEAENKALEVQYGEAKITSARDLLRLILLHATERLLLQPLGSSHADDLFQVYSDAAVMEFGDDLPHADVEVSPRRRSSECARGP
jgi:hypothetical protein